MNLTLENPVSTPENQTQFLSPEITSACEKHSLSLTYYKGEYQVFCEDTEAEYKVKTVEEFDSLVNALDTLQNLVGD